MPYPNEHSCRIKQPGEFQADSFRRIKNGKLNMIIGKLKNADKTTIQAYRYPVGEWNEDEARKHCTENDGNFESAKNSKS